jgi:hypothetical protein
VPAADEAFVPFAQLLRAVPEAIAPEVTPAADVNASPEAQTQPHESDADLARDVRLFRARLADAFDASCDAALAKSARAALGREIDALLAALLERVQ